jgi:hypothetical protein
MCGVINMDLVILLMKYTINTDACIPRWNWSPIDYPISRRPGMAERHLVHCPKLTDVQPDTDGPLVNQMRRIRLCICEWGRSAAATTHDLWARASQNWLLC